MCISLGYPDQRAERELLEGVSRRHLVDDLQTVINSETLVALRRAVDEVKASPAVLDYLQRMLAFSRNDSRFTHGLSPRAGIALLRAAKAWAVIDGRSFLIPEDLQAVLASVVDHRLKPGAARHILENVAALA